MGFKLDEINDALQQSHNNPEKAAQFLLSSKDKMDTKPHIVNLLHLIFMFY